MFRLPFIAKAVPFDESKHKRGNQKNRGQFGAGGSGAAGSGGGDAAPPGTPPPPKPTFTPDKIIRAARAADSPALKRRQEHPENYPGEDWTEPEPPNFIEWYGQSGATALTKDQKEHEQEKQTMQAYLLSLPTVSLKEIAQQVGHHPSSMHGKGKIVEDLLARVDDRRGARLRVATINRPQPKNPQ